MTISQPTLPALPCMCASFRRASRALTQRYEQAFRPLGLRATQFTILQALSLAAGVTQGELGEILAMDSTSLTRTLAIMLRQRWITARPGKDRRERRLQLASGGKTQLQRALPLWEEVQSRLLHQLGASPWQNLLQLTYQVTKSVKAQGDSL